MREESIMMSRNAAWMAMATDERVSSACIAASVKSVMLSDRLSRISYQIFHFREMIKWSSPMCRRFNFLPAQEMRFDLSITTSNKFTDKPAPRVLFTEKHLWLLVFTVPYFILAETSSLLAPKRVILLFWFDARVFIWMKYSPGYNVIGRLYGYSDDHLKYSIVSFWCIICFLLYLE